MGFYAEVQTQYGLASVKNLKSWASLNIKLAPLKNRRVFLLECKRQGLLPKHISCNMKYLYGSATDSISAGQVECMKAKTVRHVLLFEIKTTVSKIRRMEDELSRVWQTLVDTLPCDMLDQFHNRQLKKYTDRFRLIRDNNVRKLTKLISEQLSKVQPQKEWVKNISSVAVPERVLNFLALGPKFGIEIPRNEVSIQKLLADIEFTIGMNESLNDEGKNIFRSLAANTITNYVRSNRGTNNVFQNEFYYCKRYLKDHQDLLVMQSDKGNVTVLMDRSQYVDLSREILEDDNHYKILPRDPTTSMQTKCNSLVKNLVNKGYITESEGKRLYNYNAVPARFYGLPKIHKPTLTLRPIVSFINTPTSKLSIYMADILARTLAATEDRYFVKDSFSFAEFAKDLQIPDNYVLISLDVVSLFSNISVDLVISAIESRWTDIEQHTSIPKDEFISMVKFLFSSNYFLFDGKFYSQILGSPLGSNFIPAIAKIVMIFLLDLILANLPFYIPFLKGYVDDLITAVPKDQVTYTLRKFNECDEFIKFTLEEETLGSVPFLDTKVIRTNDNNIILDWYRKPTSSGRYIHFLSNHPSKQKINLILGLKSRIERIVHPTKREANLNVLFQLMRNNGYPRGLLSRLIYNSSPSGQPQRVREGMSDGVVPTVESASATLELRRDGLKFSSIPLIEGVTGSLVRLLKTDTIKVLARNEFRVKKLFSRVKDKMDVLKMSGVVYGVPCASCGEIYVGQTSQQLKKRLTQHKSDVKNPSKACALAEHVRSSGHQMNYNAAKVLECENNLKKRTFLEMCHIKRHSNSMNYRRDIEGISNIYAFLLSIDQLSGEKGVLRPGNDGSSVVSDVVVST
ncbi:uncharacterized protein LOC123307022 [Coccinella septempunctata]|uniref:uncharacterized protein LOC123307022 n=1 Tax=Coccinella septempunctata TaxID=41139 RepID=UPI001D08539E|nr:uncharacterized protein LOC123307022 [Coccinella septempunctata]